MLLEAETNKYCPGGYDIGVISNLITWVLNFFLSALVAFLLFLVSLLLHAGVPAVTGIPDLVGIPPAPGVPATVC